ncbi:hypothetical protein PHMEG_00022673 [Phytophthora megakarya]|uniref:Uncharacterized protein n=1 Tax=Phytophthora megakarya TaxID=4795 RepID=A0A225VK63_9STRA|nr:hypothetical protein PHMEG_00022673 [Phytophthora megakarya]
MSSRSRSQSNNSSDSSSERESHNDTHSAGSSSSSDAVGSATINGPYRVGNSDGDTCSYHAVQEGESCRQPRTCYECLNSDVAGVSAGCLLAPSGFCEDMSSYEANLDFRRNTTGEDLSLTGWYNYYPSANSTYCEPTDDACLLCDELVNNGSLSQASHWGSKSENASTEVERQFCIGKDGCVCVMACETDNWEANMPAECDANGPVTIALHSPILRVSMASNSASVGSTDSIVGESSRSNSAADACAYYGLEPGETCFTQRTCYDCLNVRVANNPEGCLISQFGYCASMVFYDSTLDYRVTAGPNADSGSPYNFSGGLYHQYPSVNTTYCEATDPACLECNRIAVNYSIQNNYLARTTKYCLGQSGCVCVLSCDPTVWKLRRISLCGDSGSTSSVNSNSNSSTWTPYTTSPLIIVNHTTNSLRYLYWLLGVPAFIVLLVAYYCIRLKCECFICGRFQLRLMVVS